MQFWGFQKKSLAWIFCTQISIVIKNMAVNTAVSSLQWPLWLVHYQPCRLFHGQKLFKRICKEDSIYLFLRFFFLKSDNIICFVKMKSCLIFLEHKNACFCCLLCLFLQGCGVLIKASVIRFFQAIQSLILPRNLCCVFIKKLAFLAA